MSLQKRTGGRAPDDEPVPVTVESLPGRTDAEVVRKLGESSATDVSVLTPGFISARLAPARFADLEGVAVVHRKARKRPL